LATLRDRLNQKMGIAKSWDQYQWGGHPACLGILITGKMPVPPRCRFHKTLQIIPLLSNVNELV